MLANVGNGRPHKPLSEGHRLPWEGPRPLLKDPRQHLEDHTLSLEGHRPLSEGQRSTVVPEGSGHMSKRSDIRIHTKGYGAIEMGHRSNLMPWGHVGGKGGEWGMS